MSKNKISIGFLLKVDAILGNAAFELFDEFFYKKRHIFCNKR